MELNRNELESLKIIDQYSNEQGYVGLSILERKLFDVIGFEFALQNSVRVVEVTRKLSEMGLIKKQGLSNTITQKGKQFPHWCAFAP